MDKKPRAAFVTGASYGIGKATAIALAEDGFDIAITDLSLAALQGTQAAIAALGKKVLPIVMDLQKQDSIDLAITLADKEFTPAISTTDANNAMSLSPTKDAALLLTNVETNTLGTPMGRFLIAKEEIVEPPLPPRAKMASSSPFL